MNKNNLTLIEEYIGGLAVIVKNNDAKLPKEHYDTIVKIRELCNQIIEEEIGKC